MEWKDAAKPPKDTDKKYVVRTITPHGHVHALLVGIHYNEKGKAVWGCTGQAVTQWLDEDHGCGTSEKQSEKSRCCGRCDGVNDICVADMVCDAHRTEGCRICYK